MEHTARLEVWVRRHRLSHTVTAGKGIEGVLEVFGVAVDRGEDVADSLFDRKDVQVTVVSKGQLAGTPAKQPEGLGSLKLLQGVCPVPREWDGYRTSDPPIEADVEVDNESFAALASQLANAEARRVTASLTIRIGGSNVPAPEDARQQRWGVPLARLDTQKTRTYDLLSLGFGTSQRDWHPGRVPRAPVIDEPRHSIAMSLVEARADIDLDTSLVRGIEADFVLRDYKSPINGSRVNVSWEEHPLDHASQDYPDLAEAGSFDARVPKVSADPSGCDLYLYLRYTQRDARDFLLPLLLNRPSGLAVEMDAVLIADARMMHAEPEGSTGQIAKYALRLSRLGA